MSTRSQIGFYKTKESNIAKPDAFIYRHSDGYPGTENGSEYGVLADIIPFLKWFKNARGIADTEYCSARLLQWLCNHYDGFVRFQMPYDEKEPLTGVLGHGISNGFHGDIEYYYRVYPNVVEVYETPYDAKPENWVLIKTIEL